MKIRSKIRSKITIKVCAHCDNMWFSNNISCKKCEFGICFDAVWIYGGLIKALLAYIKLKFNYLKGNFKNV
jgi:hypothetical protein